jgi:pentose-5-phosphate-3-epimerase
MLMTTLLQNKKISELHQLTEKYKQQYKKEVHGTVRSQENDLAHTQQVNFCRMAGSILKAPNSSTGGLRSILSKDIVEEFIKETSDSSFVVPNNEMVLNSMSHLLVELAQRAIENQIDCYSNIISIYSEHHLSLKRAAKPTWAHRSQKHHKNVIRRNGNSL